MATQNVKDFTPVNSINLINDSILFVKNGELVRLNGLNVNISGINQITSNNINITGSFSSVNRPLINGTGVLLQGESITSSQISDSTSAGRTLLTSTTQGQRESLATFVTANNFASLPATGLGQRVYITVNDWRIYGWVSGLNEYKEISPTPSGELDNRYASITNLATTGSTLQTQISNIKLPVEYVIACSDETSLLTTGFAKVTFRAPVTFRLTGVSASVNIAASGSNVIVDINNNSNSVLSTKLSIDATEKTSLTAASPAIIDTNYRDFSKDAEITIDIDQIGTTFAGRGLKTTLLGERL
jgi:hypothetical protein